MSKCLPFVTALLLSLQAFAGGWGKEYWQYVNWQQLEKGNHKLYFRGEARFHKDFSQFYYYRVSENYAYQALPNLALEGHYSFIHEKSLGALNFTNTHRFEFEVNPSVTFENKIQLRFRNRLELLKREDLALWRFVLRQRSMAVFPIENFGRLFAWRFSNEIFYSFESHLFNQNRFVPIELAFQISEGLEIDLFFMVRNFISSNKWRRSFVLGSDLEF